MKLKIPPLLQLVLIGAGMLLVSKLTPTYTLAFSLKYDFGIALFLLGGAIALIGVLEFRRAKTTVDPRYPDKTEFLVMTGIYQFSRNPMYLGFLIILFGWFFVLTNLVSLLLIPLFIVCMNELQIKPEERFLSDKFGYSYQKYCAAVRRWL